MTDSSTTPETNDSKPIWAVAANVVFEREYGPEHEKRSGTKHFRPGSKVHIIEMRTWNEAAYVVGRQRTSGQIIGSWVRPEHLTNPRADLVYHPLLKEKLANNHLRQDVNFTPTKWDGSQESKNRALDIVEKSKHFMKQQPFVTRTAANRPNENTSDIERHPPTWAAFVNL